ncbi:MAG: FAD-binding oxidoreductase, partial [Thermoleophilaceae bacterium]|nr:FAD-binding oxidoreductase [Thermoleophilaceae bacterium]
MSPIVNDVHSALNATEVRRVVPVDSLAAIQQAVAAGRREGAQIAIAGGFHAMGGQQFRSGGILLDTRPLDGVLGLDRERGVVEVEAGVQWPGLMRFLEGEQTEDPSPWAIVQKQSGADRLSIAGSISANAHGRGLDLRPMVADVESLVLVGPDGEARRCSRTENAELFALAIGGYGLFGVIASVALRLRPRQKLERVVVVLSVDELMDGFESRIHDGYVYGDFQFSTDEHSENFLDRGVFSCYRPVDPDTPVLPGQTALTPEDWQRLLFLAHADKTAAYEAYVGHYLATSGQVYYSDTHQMAEYADGYHVELDHLMGATHRASEMITEIYVPRGRLTDFMAEAAADFREHGVDLIYGTVRLIRRDTESFLAWAREDYACVIFNLHTVHIEEGELHSAEAFRRLIDMAIERGGSYYLTYHR